MYREVVKATTMMVMATILEGKAAGIGDGDEDEGRQK